MQSVESRRPVTEELQRLIWPARAERLGAIPVTTRLIEITSSHQRATIDPCLHRAGQREDERPERIAHSANAPGVNLGALRQIAYRLSDVGNHLSRHVWAEFGNLLQVVMSAGT